jgi:hypothetical protein
MLAFTMADKYESVHFWILIDPGYPDEENQIAIWSALGTSETASYLETYDS